MAARSQSALSIIARRTYWVSYYLSHCNFVVDLNFTSDQEILKYALTKVQQSDDIAALTCAEAIFTPDEVKIDLPETIDLHGASAAFLMQNLEWFCCSFVQNISLGTQVMDIDEVSAFDEEGQIDLEKSNDVFTHIQIDYQRLKVFFKKVQQQLDEKFKTYVSDLIELIEYEWSTQNPDTKLMCARGLFMLLHIESLSDFAWQNISHDIITLLNKVFSSNCD